MKRLLGAVAVLVVLGMVFLGMEGSISSAHGKELDVIFLLDGSGSILLPDFDLATTFAWEIASSALGDDPIGQIRFGLAQFSTNSRFEFYLNTYVGEDPSILQSAFYDARYYKESQWTYLAAAMRYVAADGFVVARGMRPDEDDVERLCIIITDGMSQDGTDSSLLDAKGVKIVAIAVGGFDPSQLEEITDPEDFFTAAGFDELQYLVDILVSKYFAPTDTDGDGVPDDEDVCPGGDDNVDPDGDGIPDFCDTCPNDSENDQDNDGVCGDVDNCPEVDNANQSNNDPDDEGDACDDDDDNDGILDTDDNCSLTANPDQADADGDDIGDVCDTDADGDGVNDGGDLCLDTTIGEVVDEDGCSVSQLCPCDNDWKNHGAYVKCVAHASENFVASGLITEEEKDAVVTEAAESACGHKK